MLKIKQLITLLQQSSPLSAAALQDRLALSRDDLEVHIEWLNQHGMTIVSQANQYQLAAPIELLDRDTILASLPKEHYALLEKLEIFTSIDSTNTYLIQQVKLMPVQRSYVCFTEQQSAGRGRQGRPWASPFGTNLYFSLSWPYPPHLQQLSGLSLAIAVMISRALTQYGIPSGLAIKWPNDLIFARRKLAGVLLELVNLQQGAVIIIGIGLNTKLPIQLKNPAWIDLAEIIQKPVARNTLASLLLRELLSGLTIYKTCGLDAFTDEWRRLDATLDQRVTLQTMTHTQTGIARGINAAGELLLEDSHGHLQRFHYGEVSLRLL